MKISKFVNSPEKPFHTSGYAEVASGNNMGATSAESFSRRKRIDQHRRAIGKYRQSHIGHANVREQVRLRSGAMGSPRLADVSNSSRQRYNAEGLPNEASTRSPAVTPTFKEPPKRNFNPFS